MVQEQPNAGPDRLVDITALRKTVADLQARSGLTALQNDPRTPAPQPRVNEHPLTRYFRLDALAPSADPNRPQQNPPEFRRKEILDLVEQSRKQARAPNASWDQQLTATVLEYYGARERLPIAMPNRNQIEMGANMHMTRLLTNMYGATEFISTFERYVAFLEQNPSSGIHRDAGIENRLVTDARALTALMPYWGRVLQVHFLIIQGNPGADHQAQLKEARTQLEVARKVAAAAGVAVPDGDISNFSPAALLQTITPVEGRLRDIIFTQSELVQPPRHNQSTLERLSSLVTDEAEQKRIRAALATISMTETEVRPIRARRVHAAYINLLAAHRRSESDQIIKKAGAGRIPPEAVAQLFQNHQQTGQLIMQEHMFGFQTTTANMFAGTLSVSTTLQQNPNDRMSPLTQNQADMVFGDFLRLMEATPADPGMQKSLQEQREKSAQAVRNYIRYMREEALQLRISLRLVDTVYVQPAVRDITNGIRTISEFLEGRAATAANWAIWGPILAYYVPALRDLPFETDPTRAREDAVKQLQAALKEAQADLARVQSLSKTIVEAQQALEKAQKDIEPHLKIIEAMDGQAMLDQKRVKEARAAIEAIANIEQGVNKVITGTWTRIEVNMKHHAETAAVLGGVQNSIARTSMYAGIALGSVLGNLIYNRVMSGRLITPGAIANFTGRTILSAGAPFYPPIEMAYRFQGWMRGDSVTAPEQPPVRETPAQARVARAQARIDATARVRTLSANSRFQDLIHSVRTHAARAIRIPPAQIAEFLGARPPSSIQGIALTAHELHDVHNLCRLRIVAAAQALGPVLTPGQEVALLTAHYTEGNVAKLAVLTHNGTFTRTQAMILVDSEVSLAGFANAGRAGGVNPAPLGSSFSGIRVPRPVTAVAGPALRFGGFALTAYMVYGEGQVLAKRAAEFQRLLAPERRKMLTDELGRSMESARTVGGTHAFRPGPTPDTWEHIATSRTINLSIITRIDDEQLMNVSLDAVLAAGSIMGAVIGSVASGPAGWAALAGALLVLPVRRELQAREARQMALAVLDLPPLLSAHIPLTMIYEGRGPSELFQQVFNGARDNREQYEETLRRCVFNFVIPEMRRISPMPLPLLNSGTQDWTDRVWQERGLLGGFFSHPDNYNTDERALQTVRGMAYGMLRHFMVLECATARQGLEKLEKSRVALGTADQQAIAKLEAQMLPLRARIQLFGSQYYDDGTSVNDSVMAGRSGVEFAADGSVSRVRVIPGSFAGRTNLAMPHEFAGVTERGGLVQLQLHGAREEIRYGIPSFAIDGTGPAAGKTAIFAFMSGNWYARRDDGPARWNPVSAAFMSSGADDVRFRTIARAVSDVETALGRRSRIEAFLRDPRQACREEIRDGKTVYVFTANTVVGSTVLDREIRANVTSEVVFTYTNDRWMYRSSPANPNVWVPVSANPTFVENSILDINRQDSNLRFAGLRGIIIRVAELEQSVRTEAATFDVQARLHTDVMRGTTVRLLQDGMIDAPEVRSVLFRSAALAPQVAVAGIANNTDRIDDAELNAMSELRNLLVPPVPAGGARGPHLLTFRQYPLRVGAADCTVIMATATFDPGNTIRTALAVREQGVRGPYVLCAGTTLSTEFREANERVIKERTEKQGREKTETLSKELGFAGRVHAGRLSATPLLVDRMAEATVYQIRSGDDVLLVRLRFDGAVSVAVIRGLGIVPSSWAQLEDRYYRETSEANRKRYSELARSNDPLWQTMEKEARENARQRVEKERTASVTYPGGSEISTAQRAQITHVEAQLEQMRIEHGGDLFGSAESIPPALQQALSAVLASAPPEALDTYLNVLVRQNAFGTPSVQNRLIPGSEFGITSEVVQKRLGVLYGTATMADGSHRDSVQLRALFQTSVLRALAAYPQFLFDSEFSVGSFESRVRSQAQILGLQMR